MATGYTDPPSGTAPAVPQFAGAAAIASALQSLYRSYQKATIYPSGHPSVPETFRRAVDLLAAASGEQASVLVRVTRDHLLFEDEHLTEPSGALESLALLLNDLDLAALEFYAGIEATQLERFVRLLIQGRHDGVKGAALVALLEENQLDHVMAVPIDYAALNFQDGTRAVDGVPPRGEVWDNLTSILTNPSALAAAGCPEDLARQVSAAIRCQEGTGVGELRKRIRKMSRKIDRMGQAERDQLRKRLGDFIAALNPDLRSDLLRVDPRIGDELTMVADLADVIPEPDLLDALQEIDKAGERMPPQMLALLNKLVRISTDNPSLASGLEDVMANWGVQVSRTDDERPDLGAALKEVFRSRINVGFNPEPYQTFLDDLARTQLGASELPLDSRFRDPADPVDVRLQAAELAVRVLGLPGGEEHRPKLLGYIETTTNTLVEEARYEIVCDAAVLARTYSLLKTQTEQTRHAAAGYLDGFSKDSRIKTILRHACVGERLSEAALSLLSLGGDNAADHALDFLDTRLHVGIAASLRRFVVERGPDSLAVLMERRWTAGWPRLRPLVPVLREFDPGKAVPLIERLLRHPESRVRREALNLICEIDDRPRAAENHLRRALSDTDQSLVAFAVFRLSNSRTLSSLRLLGDYLRGRIAGPPPTLGMVVRVARALAAGDLVGLEQLCAVLDNLRWKMEPRLVMVACALREVLDGHREVPEVEACLRRWAYSPAKMLGRVLPAVRRASKGGAA